MTTWFRKLAPILATAAYLVLFTLLFLQATVWSAGDSEADVVRVLLSSLPLSVFAFALAWGRDQTLWFWAMCGLLNGVAIYLIALVFAKSAVGAPKWKAVIRALSRCGGITLAIGAACVFWVPEARVPVFRTLDPTACLTDELRSIPNLSGMRFEISYTNCDTLAKEEYVTVYVARASAKEDSLLARWSNRPILVFGYDPDGSEEPPSIAASGKERILISIPRVSSVFFQSREWRNVSIDYDVGRIDYR